MRILKGLLWLLPLALHAQAKSVTVAWTDTSNPANTTYNLYKLTGTCVGAPAFNDAAHRIQTGLTVKTFTDANVNPGTYCYQVTAVNPAAPVNSNESVPAPPNGAQAVIILVSPPTTVVITIQ